jgi:hypothetical protein
MLGELTDFYGPGLAQEVDELQAARAGQRLEEGGLQGVDPVGWLRHYLGLLMRRFPDCPLHPGETADGLDISWVRLGELCVRYE